MAAGMASSVVFVPLLLAMITTYAGAMDIVVPGWSNYSQQSDSLKKWAHRTRFNIGDQLLFPRSSSRDTLLEVSEEAYKKCNTSSFIQVHRAAEEKSNFTKVPLNKPGPHYFIAGTGESCEHLPKLVLVVITPRKSRVSAPSSSPGVSPLQSPALSPLDAGIPPAAAAAAPTSAASSLNAASWAVFGLFVFSSFV